MRATIFFAKCIAGGNSKLSAGGARVGQAFNQPKLVVVIFYYFSLVSNKTSFELSLEDTVSWSVNQYALPSLLVKHYVICHKCIILLLSKIASII